MFSIPHNSRSLFFIAALIFSYTLARALCLSITWDEANTYLNYVEPGTLIPNQYGRMSANNHHLNTLLEIFFVRLLSLSELSMRLPSLIGHLLYLFFSAKIIGQMGNRWQALSSYLIVNLNPYMLEFFALGRGYGLSLGLMIASLYYFQKKNASLSLLFGGLATFANLVLLHYFVALSALVVITIGKSRRLILPLIISVGLIALILPIALNLKNANALFLGGTNGFFSETVSSALRALLYDFSGKDSPLIWGSIVAVYGLAVWQTRSLSHLGSSVLILGLSSLSSVLTYHLFEIPFLIGRTSLFLVVLFSLVLVWLLAEPTGNRGLSLLKQSMTHLCGGLLLFHTLTVGNLKSAADWPYDADTKQMLKDLEQMQTQTPKKIVLGVTWHLRKVILFYTKMNHLHWLETSDKTDLSQDYFYLTPQEFLEFNPGKLQAVKVYPSSKNVLARQLDLICHLH